MREQQIEGVEGRGTALGGTAPLVDIDAAAVLVADWVRSAVGRPSLPISVLVLDERDRLREALTTGQMPRGGRLRSSRRRSALRSAKPLLVPLQERPWETLAILPIHGRGGPLGIIEMVAPAHDISARRPLLDAAIQAATPVLAAVLERSEMERDARLLGSTLRLTAQLAGARSQVAAVRAAVQLCSEQLSTPVAGWLEEDADEARIIMVRGLGERKRRELQGSLGRVEAADLAAGPARHRLIARFERIAGADGAFVDAGMAFLIVAGVPARYDEFFRSLGSLLEDVLTRIRAAALSDVRMDRTDLGIAWTAHELRAPLLAVRTAIDHLLRSSDWAGADADLLRRSSEELANLVELVDPLLRWSSGKGRLRRRQLDLVPLVREAIGTCTLNGGEERITLVADAEVLVRADARQLRSAVANIVRNALIYSPPGSPIIVRVERKGGLARIRVKDRGPGVPASERDRIFDLFSRGRTRGGTGLGLFITRRVVEAHEGAVILEPAASGATFRIELPLASERGRAASAS